MTPAFIGITSLEAIDGNGMDRTDLLIFLGSDDRNQKEDR